MAPYNLSDFAVKEIKIPSSQLHPALLKSYVGKFLMAHFLDFWLLVWINATATYLFKTTFQTFLGTGKLSSTWDTVNFSPAAGFTFTAFAMTYFFTCYFMNHGQTWGMKMMRCRVRIKEHNFHEALLWTLKTLATYASLGFATKGFEPSIVAHDHLWLELVTLKEVGIPDVRTIVTRTEDGGDEKFVKAA